ncbi:cGMP-specific 3' [Blattella germanica]|nr:cGMP-specific 3' [Blattella germanica]
MEGEVSEEAVSLSSRVCSEDVEQFLESHPDVVEKWLLEKAEPDFIQRLLSGRGSVSVAGPGTEESHSSSTASLQQEEGHGGNNNGGIIPRSKRNSVTSELFQLWLAASPIKRAKSPSRPVASSLRRKQLDMMDESELFMELIRDVANELDIDVLCHKILVNVGLLTHADRGSLFLARGPRDARYLVAKLFDVTVDTGKFHVIAIFTHL